MSTSKVGKDDEAVDGRRVMLRDEAEGVSGIRSNGEEDQED